MKWLTIKLIELKIRRSKKQQKLCENDIVKGAYSQMIRNLENTIIYIKSTK